MGLPTYGTMSVDWEERVRVDRLREERLARISGLLAESELGALVCFGPAWRATRLDPIEALRME